MTKTELIAGLANEAGISKAQAERVLTALADVTKSQLHNGEEAILPGLGKLVPSERSARKGRNPQTGAEIDIPAGKGVKFKAAQALKDAL